MLNKVSTVMGLNDILGFRLDYDLKGRTVNLDYITHNNIEYMVLTIDLREKSNPYEDIPLWETIVYCEHWHGEYKEKYSTIEEAHRGHENVVTLLSTDQFKSKLLKDLGFN